MNLEKWQRIKALEALSRSLNKLSGNLESVRDHLAETEKRSAVQRRILEIRLQFMAFREEARAVVTGTEAAIQGQLSPFLLRPEDLDKVIELLGPEHIGNPLVSQPGDLLDLPTSVMFRGEELCVIIHVPRVRYELEVFRYVAVPRVVQDQVVKIRSGGLLVFEARTSLYKEVRPEVLDECWRVHQDRVCQQPWALIAGHPTSCLEALFVADETLIATLCEAQVVQGVDITLTKEVVYVSNPKVPSWSRDCPGQAPHDTPVSGSSYKNRIATWVHHQM